ncbi:MAG: hypothetical protein V3S64_05655, partial [bacterium]
MSGDISSFLPGLFSPDFNDINEFRSFLELAGQGEDFGDPTAEYQHSRVVGSLLEFHTFQHYLNPG